MACCGNAFGTWWGNNMTISCFGKFDDVLFTSCKFSHDVKCICPFRDACIIASNAKPTTHAKNTSENIKLKEVLSRRDSFQEALEEWAFKRNLEIKKGKTAWKFFNNTFSMSVNTIQSKTLLLILTDSKIELKNEKYVLEEKAAQGKPRWCYKSADIIEIIKELERLFHFV